MVNWSLGYFLLFEEAFVSIIWDLKWWILIIWTVMDHILLLWTISLSKKNSDFFYSMKTVVTCTACRTTDSSTIKI